jgi:hypothetical protein
MLRNSRLLQCCNTLIKSTQPYFNNNILDRCHRENGWKRIVCVFNFEYFTTRKLINYLQELYTQQLQIN